MGIRSGVSLDLEKIVQDLSVSRTLKESVIFIFIF